MTPIRVTDRRPQSPPAPGGAPRGGRRVPVVGIGCSAGGLEALERFLGRVPRRSGAAYVIVQHLDPTRRGVMARLLQRVTVMPVVQIRNGMRLAADRVHVIPPNRNLSVAGGILSLSEPAEPPALRHPVDFFFRSLADDQRERSIGVILSGAGSDGTRGLRAIKEQGGTAFVQSPASARFDGMPQSAIHARLSDVIAAAEELPARIAALLDRRPKQPRPRPAAARAPDRGERNPLDPGEEKWPSSRKEKAPPGVSERPWRS